MLIGGANDVDEPVASVSVLVADGSGWSELPPLTMAHNQAFAAFLPGGKVLVAGGETAADSDTATVGAELWDPATQA